MRHQILRSNTTTVIPGSAEPPGTLAVNFADGKLWVYDAANNPLLLADIVKADADALYSALGHGHLLADISDAGALAAGDNASDVPYDPSGATVTTATNTQAAVAEVAVATDALLAGLVYKGQMGFNDADPAAPTGSEKHFYIFNTTGTRSVGTTGDIIAGDWYANFGAGWVIYAYADRGASAASVSFDPTGLGHTASTDVQAAIADLDGAFMTQAEGDAAYTPIAHASLTSNPHSVTAAQVGAVPASTGGTFGGDVNVTGTLTATVDVVVSSDRRLKNNLQTIDNALLRVSQLQGYTYAFNNHPGERFGGLIAQEVQNVLPEAVSENAAGTLSISLPPILGLLVNAVNELSAEVEALRRKVWG